MESENSHIAEADVSQLEATSEQALSISQEQEQQEEVEKLNVMVDRVPEVEDGNEPKLRGVKKIVYEINEKAEAEMEAIRAMREAQLSPKSRSETLSTQMAPTFETLESVSTSDSTPMSTPPPKSAFGVATASTGPMSPEAEINESAVTPHKEYEDSPRIEEKSAKTMLEEEQLEQVVKNATSTIASSSGDEDKSLLESGLPSESIVSGGQTGITTQQPFRLLSLARHEEAQKVLASRERRRREREKQAYKPFKARPMPDFNR